MNFSESKSSVLDPLFTKEVVIGRTLANKRDIVWSVRDPGTRKVLARLKNPIVPIKPLHPRIRKFIDLEENISKGEPPNFGLLFQKIEYDEHKHGWRMLTDIIKSKVHHKSFWEFVEKLKNLRKLFNKIIDQKHRYLPRHIKRRDSVEAMFQNAKKRIAQETEILDDINGDIEIDPERGDTPMESHITHSNRGTHKDDHSSPPY